MLRCESAVGGVVGSWIRGGGCSSSSWFLLGLVGACPVGHKSADGMVLYAEVRMRKRLALACRHRDVHLRVQRSTPRPNQGEGVARTSGMMLSREGRRGRQAGPVVCDWQRPK